jgi:hypothetical protein
MNDLKNLASGLPKSSSISSNHDEEWIIARRKNSKNFNRNKGGVHNKTDYRKISKSPQIHLSDASYDTLEDNSNTIDKRVQEIAEQIDECIVSLWSSGRDTFIYDMMLGCCCDHPVSLQEVENQNETRMIREIVCYGIGNFSKRYSAEMLQMACALLLRYLLDILIQRSAKTDTALLLTSESSHLIKRNKDNNLEVRNSNSNHAEVFHRNDVQRLFDSLHTIDLLLLRQQINSTRRNSTIIMSYYDPCMVAIEKRILVEIYNVLPIACNEQGKRRVHHSSTTLFYMPHCPMRLYSNVLWANWDILLERSIIIMGNSLLAYSDLIVVNSERDDPTNAIILVAPFVLERNLRWRNNSKFGNGHLALNHALRAFNDFT